MSGLYLQHQQAGTLVPDADRLRARRQAGVSRLGRRRRRRTPKSPRCSSQLRFPAVLLAVSEASQIGNSEGYNNNLLLLLLHLEGLLTAAGRQISSSCLSPELISMASLSSRVSPEASVKSCLFFFLTFC